jgi:hypothetical protein
MGISKKTDNLSLFRVSECGDSSPLLTAATGRGSLSPQLDAAMRRPPTSQRQKEREQAPALRKFVAVNVCADAGAGAYEFPRWHERAGGHG